jgi:hypothetical protein
VKPFHWKANRRLRMWRRPVEGEVERSGDRRRRRR